MTDLLTVSRASAAYGHDVVLRDVDLAIGRGEIVAVVGESGSGKSTLGRLLTGLLMPSSGVVEIEGRPWSAVSRKSPARHHVQMIFQDSRDALNPWMSALETVSEAVRVVDGVNKRHADARALELLAHIGIEGALVRRKPANLSGGQCQRVGIARALAHRPAVLVADEPTSALDVSVQAQVLALLRKLRAEEDMAIVLITHDLSLVRSLADRVCVLYRGRVLETGPAAEVMQDPHHPYTRLLIDSRPGVDGHLPVVNGEVEGHPCAYAARCPVREDDCRSLDYSRATPSAGEHGAACVHPLSGIGIRSVPSRSSRLVDISSAAGQGAVGRHSAPPQEGTK